MMFRRALKAIGGGQRKTRDVLGGRSVLVPPKPDYPQWPTNNSRRSRVPAQRLSAADRRRRNLSYLSGFIIATFVLGLIPGLRVLLFFCVVACVMLVAYLGLAMYLAANPPAGGPSRRTIGGPQPGAGHVVTQPPASAPGADGASEAAGGWYGSGA